MQDPHELYRRERGDRCRLQHGATAGGDGWADLVGCEVEREVERSDCGHHADRNPNRVAAPSDSSGVRVDRDAAAGERARLDRREGERLHAPVDLDERLLQRLADFAGEQSRKFLAALADRRCGSVEDLRALVRRQRFAHRLRRRGDRHPRLRRAHEGNCGDRRAVPRRTHNTRLVARHHLAAHGQRLHGHRTLDLRHATSGSTTDEVRCYSTVFPYAETPFAP